MLFEPEFVPDWPLDDERLVRNSDEVQEFVRWAREAPELFIDFETTGTKWKTDRPFLVGATDGQRVRIWDFRLTELDHVAPLKASLGARTGLTVATHIAFEASMCRAMGFKLGGEYADPQKMAYATNELRQPYKDHGPLTQKALVKYELGKEPVFAAAVHSWLMSNFGTTDRGWDRVPGKLIFHYNIEDITQGYELFCKLRKQVESYGQTSLVRWDAACSDVVQRAEERGIAFDKVRAKELADQYSEDYKRAQTATFEALGRAFDVASNQKLYGLLYGEWGLPMHTDLEKEGKVDDTVLKWMLTLPQVKGTKREQVIQGIHDMRELGKMKDTYLLPWLYEWCDGDVIRPNMYMEGAKTRRFSCNDPNLQNVPTRTEIGAHLRSCFVSRQGFTTYSMDESQAEYRAFAHYSGNQKLIEGYRNQRDFDIHQTVADMLGIPRKPGKNTNFGVLYGMGRDKMARNLQMTKEQARAHLERYYKTITGIKEFRAKLAHEVKLHGYVRDVFGGRRHLDVKGVHKALNSLCQMTVANLMRRAMTLADPLITEAGGSILLQVHDELIFELPGTYEDHWRVLMDVKHTAMENVPGFRVPFVSDCEQWDPNWQHGKTIELGD